MKFAANTNSMIRAPGRIVGHKLLRITGKPSAIMLPQVACGGCAPKPRKLSAASARTATPTSSVPCTIKGCTVLGRMCPRRSCSPPARREEMPKAEGTHREPVRQSHRHSRAGGSVRNALMLLSADSGERSAHSQITRVRQPSSLSSVKCSASRSRVRVSFGSQ